MRRLFLLALSLLLLGGGLTLAWREVDVAAGHVFWRGLTTAGFMAVLGGYLLWEDFIRPARRRR